MLYRTILSDIGRIFIFIKISCIDTILNIIFFVCVCVWKDTEFMQYCNKRISSILCNVEKYLLLGKNQQSISTPSPFCSVGGDTYERQLCHKTVCKMENSWSRDS